ncbi:MAG: UDP-N-acetylmuramoyl-L-alanyl-D-glutamate--2,6-diaminopimelate ligase [Planctomycetota bacterium]|nr:UDP-N-acetylmuramoyl-L-alanyl-D-glutamate--2,6-diaminopimelate ligase [Planctomycetota bacterium]
MTGLPIRPITVGALRALLDSVALTGVSVDAEITGLVDDSRHVKPGDVFFARRGTREDGERFAVDAAARGAVVVVSEGPLPENVPTLRVRDVDDALRTAADAWYGAPQDALVLIGITGTKGKTTTAYLTAAALTACGLRAGVIGTIAYDFGPGVREASINTTPGVLELRRLLAKARDAGCDAVVMEVSSHALDQGRVEGIAFRAAVFTNLASDHLDYHQTAEAYFEAKARLFAHLPPAGTAVLNREDVAWPRFAALCRGAVLTYGSVPEADVRADAIELSVEHSRLRLVLADGAQYEIETRLIGRHNVMNLLAAVGVCVGLGYDALTAAEGAAAVAGVPGRLERVNSEADLHAFVDYAHTEDALVQVLSFLRGVGAQPLTCVVGCGGDRDATKRPRMARVAAELADHAIFTSDNPRNEDPEAILDDMFEGVAEPTLRERVSRVVDRRTAIRHAVDSAPSGSTLLVAGKGHEAVQVVGTETVPFDDVEEVRDALEARRERRDAGAVSSEG